MTEHTLDQHHLDPGEVAAYVDGHLESAERIRVLEHLADCDLCRADVIEVAGALESINRRPRRRWVVPAAVAAVLAAVVFLGGPLARTGDPGDVLRAPEAPGSRASAVTIVTPASESVVAPSELVFTWNAVGDAVYRLTVTDRGGDPLWSGETRDTTMLLPSLVVLEPATAYLWYVDALLPDGRTVTTGVRRFETIP